MIVGSNLDKSVTNPPHCAYSKTMKLQQPKVDEDLEKRNLVFLSKSTMKIVQPNDLQSESRFAL